VGAEALGAKVEGLRANDPDLSVLVNADADAHHGDVAAALDVLRKSGQERVFLAGLPGDAPAPR